ncbi:MAG: hypothetical protein K6T73_10990 [Candidatus Bathyarchaeota archaeon]|nr:hypothetical protein [Candidatus Bathyarchaeota archaeon]
MPFRCMLCFPFTHNLADYAISYGREDSIIRVCKWCLEDLRLLGFNANQIIRLQTSKVGKPKIARFWFLGPVRSLLEAKA